ncbi:hypothetical protein [Marinicella gelatinilytica]|uniref:hypothetical protein n=1 Tax=Marinicella gelatinilytica TaxID=2996017 RepID=UPI002260CB3C|nr:hypothetical protein [Marinicella gelatinilytica]MCX7544962.1 hypothetical protein [Marinicella gelatinilytica]
MTKQHSIRTELEQQAQRNLQVKTNYNHNKQSQNRKKDPLRLNWRDAVIFSLLVVFSGGYWLQAPNLDTVSNQNKSRPIND